MNGSHDFIRIGHGKSKNQKGYSILELAVAMTVLGAGSAVLWYGIKAASRLDRLNKLHHSALLAARSDMESVRILPKKSIHDTVYPITAMGGEALELVRQVFDSTRIMASMDEVILDENLSPQELRKPLEVKIRVLLKDPSQGLTNDPFQWSNESDDASQSGRAIVTLILKIPEYKWY